MQFGNIAKEGLIKAIIIFMNQVIGPNKISLSKSIASIPRVTVLMSSFNGSAYIERQILSIISQRFVNILLVVRDDGSTDNTPVLLHKLSSTFPEKIMVCYGENVGIKKSFLWLFENAGASDYYAFSDDDDDWDLDKMIVAINTLRETSCSLYYSSSRLMTADGVVLKKTTVCGREVSHYMKGYNQILFPGAQGCTMLFSESFYHLIEPSKPCLMYGHDIWIPIVGNILGVSVYDKTPHMNYRQHSHSWTGDRTHFFAQKKRQIHFFLKGLGRYSTLAEDLLCYFPNELPQKQKIVYGILGDRKKTLFERIRLCLSPKLKKYGVFKNLFLKLAFLFGKY